MNQDATKELLRIWLATLVGDLATEVDERTRARLMERCGQACAIHHRSIETARALQRDSSDLDELLARLNQQEGFWCGEWVRDGNMISSVCSACGCPLVRAGFIKPSLTFCDCSLGWVQAVFGAVLEGPVTVELSKAIGRGDPVCEYIVGFTERPGR